MESATLLAVAERRDVAAGCVLAVSDLVADQQRIGAEALEAAEKAIGTIAATALA